MERIAQSILVLRNHKVLFDADLAAMYGVDTKVLLQAVKRNLQRFPADFMLQLTAPEWTALRSQFVTLKLREMDWAFVNVEVATDNPAAMRLYGSLRFSDWITPTKFLELRL